MRVPAELMIVCLAVAVSPSCGGGGSSTDAAAEKGVAAAAAFSEDLEQARDGEDLAAAIDALAARIDHLGDEATTAPDGARDLLSGKPSDGFLEAKLELYRLEEAITRSLQPMASSFDDPAVVAARQRLEQQLAIEAAGD